MDKENWTDIAEVADGGKDAVRDNIFMRITKNLQGETVRYLRILITEDHGYFLKINTIDINKTVENVSSVLVGNLSGDLEKMIDGNISTLYSAGAASDGNAYVDYKITENTRLQSITLLQDATEITNAEVKAMVYDGERTEERRLGVLNQAITSFAFTGEEDIIGIRITWPQDTVPCIYEIFAVSKGEEGSTGEETVFPDGKAVYRLGSESFAAISAAYGTALKELELPGEIEVTYLDNTGETLPLYWTSDTYQANRAGTYLLKGFPITPEGAYNHAGLYADILVTVEENTDEDDDLYPDVENGNLALNCPVEESGKGLHPVTNAVDGDPDTRWEGNEIKAGASTATSWILSDLGNKNIRAERIYVRFYMKTYATDYEVQVSDDKSNWRTVKTITNENGSTQNPVDEIIPEEPITERYVRLFFRSMNANAVGHAVGIRELEIIGNRTEQDVPKPECNCEISNLTFADREAVIPADADSVDITLNAEAEITGNCPVPGHEAYDITYSYEITQDTQNIGEVNGNLLTVTGEGNVALKVTAVIENSEGAFAEAGAMVFVTKENPPATLYTMTFSGGEGAQGAGPGPIQAAEGAEVELPVNTFTKAGCTFESWSDGTAKYKEKQIFVMPGTDVEMTALWKEAVTKPGTPTGFKASENKAKSIKLSWNKVAGAREYIVSRYDSKTKKWKDMKAVSGTGYKDTGLKPATIYQYRVRAVAKAGTIVKQGDAAKTMKTATAPAKPALKAKKSGSSAKLTWNTKSKADGYVLQMKKGKGSYSNVKKFGKNKISYTKSGLKEGKSYFFRLRGYKKVGSKKIYSEYSKPRKLSF